LKSERRLTACIESSHVKFRIRGLEFEYGIHILNSNAVQ